MEQQPRALTLPGSSFGLGNDRPVVEHLLGPRHDADVDLSSEAVEGSGGS